MRKKRITMKRRLEWYVLRPLVISLIWLDKHWRDLFAIAGGVGVLVGFAGLITTDAPLYANYSVALAYLAKCWGLIIGGVLMISFWISKEMEEDPE
ncbi:MAG: hypothetical protein KIB08_06900 [Negativicoccus succinicivorans]|nr:hypothetical protein [Negativicoccus succinicivorans]